MTVKRNKRGLITCRDPRQDPRRSPLRLPNHASVKHLRRYPPSLFPAHEALLDRHAAAIIISKPHGPHGEWLVTVVPGSNMILSPISEWSDNVELALARAINVLILLEKAFIRSSVTADRGEGKWAW